MEIAKVSLFDESLSWLFYQNTMVTRYSSNKTNQHGDCYTNTLVPVTVSIKQITMVTDIYRTSHFFRGVAS